MAYKVLWDVFEIKNVGLLSNDTGNVAKPLRMALDFLIIQIRFQFPGRELHHQQHSHGYRNPVPFLCACGLVGNRHGKALPSQYNDWIGTNSFIGDGGTADAIRFEQQTGEIWQYVKI